MLPTHDRRRVGLTRNTFGQSSLLRVVNGKSTTLATKELMVDSASSNMVKSSMDSDDAAIYALPESSDDELASVGSREYTSRHVTDESTPPAKRKRAAETTRSRVVPTKRSKPAKLKDEPEPLPAMSFDSFDSLASPSSQLKRRKVDYQTVRNINTTCEEKLKISEFAAPALLSSPPIPKSRSTFAMPKAIQRQSPRRSTRNSRKVDFTNPASLSPITKKRPEPESGFRHLPLPLGLSEDLTSSAQSSTIPDSIFDAPELPADVTARKRSGSNSSSLSERSLSPSLELSPERVRDLQHDDTADGMDGRPHVRCPYCSSRIDPRYLTSPASVKHRLNMRDQQAFCLKHRIGRAKEQWQECGYPDILWNSLEQKRVPNLLDQLTAELRDVTSSYYRGKLEDAVKEAQSSRKALQQYLKYGIVDVVNYGFYGPRGARIVGQALSNSISAEVKEQLTKDQLARAAGFGGYVSAVLVPEVMMRLIMADMNITDQAEARRMLAESSELGLLLNADEDEHIEQEKL